MKHHKNERSLCGNPIPHCWNQAARDFKRIANQLFDAGYDFEAFGYISFDWLVKDLARLIECRLLTSREALGVLFPYYRQPCVENWLLHVDKMLYDYTSSRNFQKFFPWQPRTNVEDALNPLLM